MPDKIFLDQIMLQIKHYREEAGLSQAEMARRLKIGCRSYQRYESTDSIPPVNILFQAAHLLNFDLKDLFSPLDHLDKIGEIVFFKEEQKEEFIKNAGEKLSGLFKLLDGPGLRQVLLKGQLELFSHDADFMNSSDMYSLSNAKKTILNPSAKKGLKTDLDLASNTIFHHSAKNVGILWGALLQARPAYFIMKTKPTALLPNNPLLETFNIFLNVKNQYYILRKLKMTN